MYHGNSNSKSSLKVNFCVTDLYLRLCTNCLWLFVTQLSLAPCHHHGLTWTLTDNATSCLHLKARYMSFLQRYLLRKGCLGRRNVSNGRRGTLSTVHLGTAFEHRAQDYLQQSLGMALHRVGGARDGGIDLTGWWDLPSYTRDETSESASVPNRLRVIAQCKAEKGKVGPRYIREIEGVAAGLVLQSSAGYPPGGAEPRALSDIHGRVYTVEEVQRSPVVALLVSQSPFTKEAYLRAVKSPVPLMLVELGFGPEVDSEFGVGLPELAGEAKEWLGPKSIMANPSLISSDNGVLRGQLEVRTEKGFVEQLGLLERPCVWWMGQRLSDLARPPSSRGE